MSRQKFRNHPSASTRRRKRKDAPVTTRHSKDDAPSPQLLQQRVGNRSVQRLVQLTPKPAADASYVQRDDNASSWRRKDTYTAVKTKRLNQKGAFTSGVLHVISTMWTKAAALRSEKTAKKIVDALEASGSFVNVAKKLDRYYGRKNTVGIHVSHGHTGTKFVPAGTYYRWVEEQAARTDEDEDNLFIDFDKPEIDGSEAGQISQFVTSLIHEANHAYNLRVAKTKKGGLRGHLQEEKRTRKAEIKALEEIRSKTTDRSLKKELGDQIAETRKSGLGERGVAKSMPSAGGATYLESFFLSAAIDRFRTRVAREKKKVRARGWAGFEGLADIQKSGDINLLIYRMNANLLVRLNQPPIRRSKARMLLNVLDAKKTLKQITRTSTAKLNAAERLMLNQILLLKSVETKIAIRKEWQHFARTGGNRDALLRRIAKRYLGRPNAYKKLPKK